MLILTAKKKLLLSLCVTTVLCGFLQYPAGAETLPPAEPAGEAALDRLDDRFLMEDGFRSHLPVVILREDAAADFYGEGEALSAGLLAKPTDMSGGYAQRWSESGADGRPDREKADYSLQFSEETAAALGTRLWDSPVRDEWYLLGGMYDKSLMRNYLALTLAGEMGSAAYLAHYCEVFTAGEEGYRYQGVYLLAAPADTGDYHFQRGDYWHDERTPLDTYATRNGLLSEGLYAPDLYEADAAVLAGLEETVDMAETSIFSGDYNEFSKYSSYLDMEKVYDYFILYELFGNYAAAHLTHYVYDADTHTFWPAALADFEFSVDNEQDAPMDFQALGMIHTPYYSALIKSVPFVNGLQERYRLLSQELLKSSNLSRRIDQIAAFLGDSQIRDWQRWQQYYDGPEMYRLDAGPPAEDGAPAFDRNTGTYAQEINKLKVSLRQHGLYMFNGISQLFQQKNMAGRDASYVRNAWFLSAFLVVVFLSVRIARRRTR